MRRLLPALLLVSSLAAAGCATQQNGNPAPVAGWQLDCSLGPASLARDPAWAQACEARASHTRGPKEETWLSINPKDPSNVVVAAKDLNPDSSNCVWNGVFVTKDGGKTWSDVTIGGSLANRTPTSPFYGYACNTDPDFRFDGNGDVHYGVEVYNLGATGANCVEPSPTGVPDPTQSLPPCGFKILLATSHDGGLTWPDVITYQPDFGVTTDYSRMAVNPVTQSILESIGGYGGTKCNLLASRDGGKTANFEPIATKDGIPCDSDGNGAIAGSLRSGPLGKGTMVLAGGNPLVVARSTDDGLTWSDSNQGFAYLKIPDRFAESRYRTTDTLELAYDNSNGTHSHPGTLYACYPAGDRPGDEADIFVRSSADDGRTWSPAVRVNGDPPGAHQWMCNIAVAGDGSVHVFFADKQYDPKHVLIDITHAWSVDGGKTWTDQRVSTVPYDGELGKHQQGFPFIGDYIGVDCVKVDCWAGFPDASNGNTTVVAAAHVHMT